MAVDPGTQVQLQTQPVMPPVTTPAWQSKTMWVSLLTMVVPMLYPPAAVWVADNPQLVMAGLGAVFGGLRVISHGKIAIK